MKILLILFFFLSMITNSLHSQDKMIVNDNYSGNIVYNGSSYLIDSIQELPDLIQYNINGYFERILGELRSNISFSHGQVVDLKKYFLNDSSIYNRGWIAPKYDLHFQLVDSTIGIIRYYIKIRLDDYGQIINCNWPKKLYNEKSRFKSRADIKSHALRVADIRIFDTTNYEVDFRFNEKEERLCWIFKFPKKMTQQLKIYDVIEIDWLTNEIIDEYGITQTIHYD